MALPLDTFEQLYRRHYGYVVSALRRFGVDPAHVEDVAQEVFIVAYRRIDGSIVNMRPWLYGIARRTASNHRRSLERQQRKHHTVAETTDMQRPPQRYENILAVDEFLRNLPGRDREVFVLSEIEGLSGPEVAAALKLKTSTTYARLRAIRTRFDAHVHPAEPRHLLTRCREERPQGSWAALLPLLKTAPPVSFWGLSALGFSGSWVLPTVAIGIPSVLAASLGVAIGLRAAAPSDSPPPARATGTTTVAQPVTREPVPPVEPASDATEVSSPADSAVARVTPSTRPGPRPRDRRPTEPTRDSLAWQSQLLREATVALRDGRFEDALERTATLAREVPGGPLAEPRSAVHVEALCGLGRADEARREVLRFEQTYPASPMLSRVRKACR